MGALENVTPSWMTANTDGSFEADTDKYYPILFAELKGYAINQQKKLIAGGVEAAENKARVESSLTKSATTAEILAGCNELASCIKFGGDDKDGSKLDTKSLTQYCLEVAYTCLLLDSQHAIRGSGKDPRDSGETLHLTFVTKKKIEGTWSLKTHKAGRGIDAAAKGREGRAHYLNMRGFVPQ